MLRTTFTRTQETTACTTALGNPDILEHIIAYVLSSYTPLSSLEPSRLALVCKDFLEPVLDHIWYRQTSLLPLLRILPAFQTSGSCHGICGAASEGEWSRFEYYARRVRVICYAQVQGESRRLSGLAAIRLAQMRSKPLLPALHQLVICTIGECDLSWLCLCLLPTLDSVHISGAMDVTSAEIGFFLTALADNAPALSEFRISLRENENVEALSPVSRFKSLHTLEIAGTPCPHDLLKNMGMTNLTKLSVDLSAIPSNSIDAPFDSLRELCISGPLDIISGVLSQLATPVLMRLKMYPTSGTPPSKPKRRKIGSSRERNIEDCLSTLSRRWAVTLEQLSIVDRSDCFRFEDTTNFATLLVQLTQLQHFDLQSTRLFLPSVDVLKVAASWPNATHLSLPLQNYAMTVQDLGILASSCPLLEYFQIYLDISFISPFVAGPPILSSLRTLSVGSANGFDDIQTILKVAQYLDHYFQRLETIQGYDSLHGDGWRQVMDAVRIYQTVRADARAMWLRGD